MTAVQTGNIVDAGPEEYYVSTPQEIPRGQAVAGIDWEAECGPGTWVHAQVRWADSVEALARSAWQGAGGPGTWYETPQPVRAAGAGPWVQYRLALGAKNGGSTPRVTEVRLETG